MMSKDLLILIIAIFFAAACGSAKPATSGNSASSNGGKSSVTFIDNISVTPGTAADDGRKSNLSNATSPTGGDASSSGTIESFSALQFKYAILTNTSVEQMNNEKLLDFMEEWYGKPYHYGGTTKDGIDCSAFSCLLISTVYGVNHLARTSKDQFEQSKRIKKDQLQEGDLVFFHTIGKNGRKNITHVGVYLLNNKFVHASASGVMISDMNEGYYAKHFVGAGRIRD